MSSISTRPEEMASESSSFLSPSVMRLGIGKGIGGLIFIIALRWRLAVKKNVGGVGWDGGKPVIYDPTGL